MTDRVTEYRRKLKATNPLKYKDYLEYQKKNSKLRRDQMKNELKKRKPDRAVVEKYEREKLLARERQRRYMEKKRQTQAFKDKIIGKPKTRKSVEMQRFRWRVAKQKERSAMSHQKKLVIRRKERERRLERELKDREKKNRSKASTSSNADETSVFSSPKTEWNITATIRSQLPRTPEKFNKVIQNLIKNKRRTRKAVQSLNTQKTKKSAGRLVSAQLLKKACRRNSRRRPVKVNYKLVKKFYCREDISRIMPQKRFATKHGAGHLLQVSLRSAYRLFISEYPKEKVSFSTFAKLRPRNVRLLTNTHREFCLCVYCVNIRYKMLALNRLCPEKSVKHTNENEITDILLCKKPDSSRFHLADCINGNCEACHDQEASLRRFYSFSDEAKNVTWNHWAWVEVESGKRRRMLITKTATGPELMNEFVDDVLHPTAGTTFVQHLFVAHWQSMQFNCIKNNLPENSVLEVMDFAKNRTVTYQDEIKSAFFGAKQITIHPVVSYYRKQEHVVRDSIVFISEDICHDYHAVNHFTKITDRHIEERLGRPTHKIIFSDGCSSQYKSKGPFADLSLSTGTTVNRNFFGSEHGKSEGDGETGVINRAVDRAVIGRQLIINRAYDMFQWCRDNMTLDDPLSQRHFYFVDTAEINRERPYTEVKTLPQTRRVHQALSVPGKPYHLKVRDLSCFCGSCLGTTSEACLNNGYVTPFTEKILKQSPPALEVEVPLETSLSEVDMAVDALMMFGDLEDGEDPIPRCLDPGPSGMDADPRGPRPAIDLQGTDPIIGGKDPESTQLAHQKEFLDQPKSVKQLSISAGKYFKVRHGADFYPAVVVDAPASYDEPPENTFYGHYFHTRGTDDRQWTMEDTVHLITRDEIVQDLAPPNMICHGQRLMYCFEKF